ncbi:substrate-binding domain-containing protein [Pontivivens insulae]|nr:substrate-binding domain-containing protein [Pontivivens insulae]
MIAAALLAGAAQADTFITVQSTTSTQNSGLYDAILPIFEAETGIDVRVVAVGTGQALRNARSCDGDVLLVHAKEAEEAFVTDGFGLTRQDVMYNDFVLIGPVDDPANVADQNSIAEALVAVAASDAPFASRGDDSGTHRREVSLWPDGPPASGTTYLETGQGMGATLNIAAALQAYSLTDRATWLTFANTDGMTILHEGDPALFNQYGVIVISPQACPSVKLEDAQRFADWITGDTGQSAIASYRLGETQLFTPNATR